MSREKQGKRSGSNGTEKVLVAVKASREISKTAFVWALTHIVHPGDCITLIVVVTSYNAGRKLWTFPRFAGDCATGHWKLHSDPMSEIKSDLTDTCSQMILQLHDVYDPNKVNVRIKIVSGSPCGAVAAEAKKSQANWVVLDKHLKHEEKRCIDELQCNIVAMKRSEAKVLRLNLVGSSTKEPELASEKNKNRLLDSVKAVVTTTPMSSPEVETSFTGTEAWTSSVSSSDLGTSSPVFTAEVRKDETLVVKENESDSDSESENLSLPSLSKRFQPWISEYLSTHCVSMQESTRGDDKAVQVSTKKALLEKISKLDEGEEAAMSSKRKDLEEYSGTLRALSRNAPPVSPPLCSICQHKAPVFGKPPRFFSYKELELATNGFSRANFLAEGGFGSVHRGVLPEGQIVAVKQHKVASTQGDVEFCSEVEVLSCAQHRNVVMLIGFCIEDTRRLLVYEYICNGSLDSHLYGK
jgi:hypothetical protein